VTGLTPYAANGTVKATVNGAITDVTFNYYVRIVPHAVDSTQVVDVLTNVIISRAGKFKGLQWLTGEKKLVSDLLLNMDSVKDDYSNKNKGWFGTLQRLAKLRNGAEGYFKESKIPTGSLLISRADVDEVKRLTGVAIDKKALKMIANHFMLITIAVIDESAGSLSIFQVDRPADVQVYSIQNLINLTKTSNVNAMRDTVKLLGLN
jgi:hypothetical protein